MKHRTLKIMGIKRILISFLLCVLIVPEGNAIDIVVNKSVQISALSLNKMRAIFTMRQRFWSSGEKIKVFILADDHSIHKRFTKNKLQMFPHQLRRAWDRMVFSGTGVAPITVKDEQQMIDKISNTLNAIGYLESELENNNIRVVNSE